MGLGLPGANDSAYYVANGAHGEYQYLTLEDIVEAFVATYIGKDKICEGVNVSDVHFHATRALQELSYDTLRSIKSQELEIPPSLQMLLPRDFVNYVKFTWSDSGGVEHVIYPTSKTSNPTDIGYTASTDTYAFTGSVLNSDEVSDTVTNFKSATPVDNQNNSDDDDYDLLNGQRFGLDPQQAQVNGSFFIDYATGKVHFSSNIAGKTVIIKYISDGLSTGSKTDGDMTDGAAVVHKFAEEAMYKHILYACLLARKDSSPPTLQLIKKERFAAIRNAKIRLSNIKIEEITQVLRGKSKIIKH